MAKLAHPIGYAYFHIKDKKPIYAAFIDFSKAFDSVWRQGLLKKLLDPGVGLKTFKFSSIIKDIYLIPNLSLRREIFWVTQFRLTLPVNGQLVRRRCNIEDQFDPSRRTSGHV